MAEAPRKIRSRKAQIAITAALVAATMGACALIVVAYLDGLNSSIAKIANAELGRTASGVAAWVQVKSTTIQAVSKAAASFNDHPQELQEFLTNTLGSDGDFSDIYFATAEGPGRGGYTLNASGAPTPEGFDWTTRPWFSSALKSDGIVATEPYVDVVTGRTIISVSQRILFRGWMIGVVSSDVFTETVEKIVSESFISENSKIDLLRSDGFYVADVKANAFVDHPELIPLKDEILAGKFTIKADPFKDSYYASLGLPGMNQILLARGKLSDFQDTSRTIFTLVAVLFFLAALFVLLLVRSWQSYAQLAAATAAVERANKGLEQTVLNRTAALRNILDNAEEGFFTFGEDLTIDPGYSKGCADIFGREIQGLLAPEVLFPGMTEVINDFKQGFELYFGGKSKAAIIFDLTEKKATIRDKILVVTYKETAGNKILCILNDVTLETRIAEKNREEAERQGRILRALRHKHFFSQFVDAADDLFALLDVFGGKEPTAAEASELLRALHTFKGDCGFFRFSETQETAHESETLLSDSRTLGTSVSYKEIAVQLRRAYYRELKAVTDTMGEKWLDEAGSVVIPLDAFRKIHDYVRKTLPSETKLAQYLDFYRKIPLAELFSRLPFVAAATAEKLGKKVEPMKISGGGQRVVPDRFEALAEACIHIVNNMVDHGIEYPYEREAVQKLPAGKIELDIDAGKSEIAISFSDDGRGINPREIEKIARERGLLEEGKSLSPSALLNLVFEEGFSTKGGASTVSGRGIGLAAVKAEVVKLGGTIEAKSKIGKGTTFDIVIPLVGKR